MKTNSKTSLFLMELIVVILFFSLSSTVCIQLFVKSHLLGTETQNLNHGVLQVQNMSEVFLNSSGNEDLFKNYFSQGISTSSNNNSVDYYFLFDENYEVTQTWTTSSYVALAEFSDSNSFAYASFNFYLVPENYSEEEFLTAFSNIDLAQSETLNKNEKSFESKYKIYGLDVEKYLADGGIENE